MGLAVYNELSEQQKREVACFGCTVEQMRDSVEDTLKHRITSPTRMAVSIMSDCQEVLALDNGGQYDIMRVEDVRQMLNRAKWILTNYKDQP